MKSLRLAFTVAGVIALSGCQASTVEQPLEPSDRSDVGAASIQEVWSEIGCKEDDPLGTRGVMDLTPPTAPVVSTGMCTPYEDGELAFFYELPSAAVASDWLESGGLEVGATDAVFIDGAVVILATDARTAQEFAGLFLTVE